MAPAAENMGDFIIHHVTNSDAWHPLPGVSIPLPADWTIAGVNMGITLHVLMILLTLGLLLWLLPAAARSRKGLVPASRFGHAIEAVVLYLRDEVVVPNLGRKDAMKWMPFFLTLFFFILSLNLVALVPGFASPTGNINFTAALAILVFVVYNIAGMVKNGPVHYFTNLVPKGIPFYVVILMFPIEVLGLLTKAFALAIRLFANMTAGHIIIFSLLGLIAVFETFLLVPVFLGFTLFIYLIEVMVAFLQAYIFTLLASLFVGMAIHQEH